MNTAHLSSSEYIADGIVGFLMSALAVYILVSKQRKGLAGLFAFFSFNMLANVFLIITQGYTLSLIPGGSILLVISLVLKKKEPDVPLAEKEKRKAYYIYQQFSKVNVKAYTGKKQILLPNGEAQVELVVRSISKIRDLNVDELDYKKWETIINLYKNAIQFCGPTNEFLEANPFAHDISAARDIIDFSHKNFFSPKYGIDYPPNTSDVLISSPDRNIFDVTSNLIDLTIKCDDVMSKEDAVYDNSAETINCCKCGALCRSDDLFCFLCGFKFELEKSQTKQSTTYRNFCRICGNKLKSEDIFCCKCGTKID